MFKHSAFFLTTLVFSFNAYSFHAVSEILPSGKILICQDFNQIKKGGIVEVYERFRTDTDRNVKMVKMREITLPKAGEKVKLTHSDFHQVGTTSVNEYHSEESGSATIVSSETLLGEKRLVRKAPDERARPNFNQTYEITKKDIELIEQKCLVAIPDNGLNVDELKKVSW
ncbi:hypothetical protein DOM21_09070 [Bacteriovorax stolpii]|uniref:Uncharacterized protein n=1 Tax=Bacteriovorax stolpii TaxID=960 RepID=A0A2K9NSC3_BACTC|nr:hypothetical protein [Bacteriovorax stolpii]AUN98420.1 hypothetical protein C0V70_09945 [Bacteriovorax stolpii]QDK41600.1 hypothetical protein DOM21_09070 [Bacteriovorax stolpii]TDP50957.1 hypothetical protein C8D79_3696 [Bacteriovorax stolpii]